MVSILSVWYYQLLILAVIWILVSLVKKKVPKILPQKLLPIDIVIFFMFVGAHFLTLNKSGNSIVPYILLGMAVWGIFMTLVHGFVKGELIYSAFFLRYWRFVDLAIIIIYCGLIIFKITGQIY
ncbi:DUF3397 family protein [Liquorilactobacillus uvarum]|nr:DUF3397 family protein [Liquorilactobacillus uvarum]